MSEPVFNSFGDLLKAHVKGYTRTDGTYVAEHDDKRQAAQQEAVGAVTSKHADKMHRKESEWVHDGKKVPAAEVSGLPEFSHREVYGHAGRSSPAGSDFSKEFASKGHSGFVLKHPDGKRSLVDTQGANYARYHAPIDDSPAKSSTPSIGEHADALAASSKKGELDHEDNQWAAKLMKQGDHETLRGHLRTLDTGARDHILNHIHPDHWEGLGFKPFDKQKMVAEHEKRFGGSSKAVEKPAAKKSGRGIPKAANRADTAAAGEYFRQQMAAKKSSSVPHSDSNSANWGNLPDDENPAFALRGLSSESLGKIALGKDDGVKRAKAELANRGLDSAGKWVGFKAAEKHHGVSPSGSDEVSRGMQGVHDKILSAAASGHLDMSKLAGSELANRGHDHSGKWIGFSAAEKLHGGKPLAKAILLFGDSADLQEMAKSHVKGYTRTDGTYVAEHDDKRTAAQAKPKKMGHKDALSHPDHHLVVNAASRGAIDLQHAAEKYALRRDLVSRYGEDNIQAKKLDLSGHWGEYGAQAKKLFDSMDWNDVAAASRGEIDMQHEAEKAALAKDEKPAKANSKKIMTKSILLSGDAGDLQEMAKSHVKGYTRKDGAYVAEHDDKRVAASHPSAAAIEQRMKVAYGEAEYNQPGTGRKYTVKHDGKFYRAGAMRSPSLSGLLHLIDKSAK